MTCVSHKQWGPMKAFAKYAAVLSAAGALFLSTRPVLAETTTSTSAVDPPANPDVLASIAAGAFTGAVAGAARGAVVALFGTPAITVSVATGAVAGAVSGAAGAVAADALAGRIVIESIPTPSTALD